MARHVRIFFSFRALLLPNIGMIGAIGSVVCEEDQMILTKHWRRMHWSFVKTS